MRKVANTKGAFANGKALLKILFLNLIRDPESWKRCVSNWTEIHRGPAREFGYRFTKHVNQHTIIS